MSRLEVDGLGFAFGLHRALEGLSFACAEGSFNALLGPNGAGKSTLIALLTRLYDLQRGDIRVGGHGLRRTPRAVLRQLGVVFQQSTLDLDLTVEQNLRYHAALHGLPGREACQRIDQELARQQLETRRHERVRALNGGHRRRVEIARALLHRPRLLLLDEASVGLDPASRAALNAHVRQLCRDEGLTVLWTTHLLDEVQADDALLVLDRGRLVAAGSVADIGAGHPGGLAEAFQQLTRREAVA
jgi:ABC-2 type transport system ATP-binding protein